MAFNPGQEVKYVGKDVDLAGRNGKVVPQPPMFDAEPAGYVYVRFDNLQPTFTMFVGDLVAVRGLSEEQVGGPL